ncbi:hypothetical protein ABIA41_002759 [Bradyrhizobium sp. USDA 313]
MNEVHRPDLVDPRRGPPVVAQLGLDPALGRFIAQLQARFAIDAPRLVLPVTLSLAAQQHMDTAIASANMADLLDPSFEGRLAGATRFVVVGRSVELEGHHTCHSPQTSSTSLRFWQGFTANGMEPAHTARRVFDREEEDQKMLSNKPQPAAVFGIEGVESFKK